MTDQIADYEAAARLDDILRLPNGYGNVLRLRAAEARIALRGDCAGVVDAVAELGAAMPDSATRDDVLKIHNSLKLVRDFSLSEALMRKARSALRWLHYTAGEDWEDCLMNECHWSH